MIDREQIREFSSRRGIDEFTTIREFLQVVFLSALYRKKEARKIYFKGGTAIHLLFHSNRFSEDLDFTAGLKAAAVHEIVSDAVKVARLIVPGISFKRVDEAPQARGKNLTRLASYSGILGYQDAGMKYPLNVHLEFSLREKAQTSRETVLGTDFPISALPIIRHLDWPEILAEKVRALLVRSKGRDVYDLCHLLQNGVALDWKMVNKKTKLYGLSASMTVLMRKVHGFEERLLRNDLGKFLPTHERNLVRHLKVLALEQLEARREFSISTSVHLLGSGTWGGSYSGLQNLVPDLRKTIIGSIGLDETGEMLTVEFKDEQEHELSAVIGTRDKIGVLQLKEAAAKQEFIGKSYDEFIYTKIRFSGVE